MTYTILFFLTLWMVSGYLGAEIFNMSGQKVPYKLFFMGPVLLFIALWACSDQDLAEMVRKKARK